MWKKLGDIRLFWQLVGANQTLWEEMGVSGGKKEFVAGNGR